MAITDESSLLREKLREQQMELDMLRGFLIEYYLNGGSSRGEEWTAKYLDSKKPEDNTIQE